jgi:hypothetical protein
MWVKGHNKGGDTSCRCCKSQWSHENLQHLATCTVVGSIFRELAAMMGLRWDEWTMKEKERFALFLDAPVTKKNQEGWINLHLLLWKHIIANLVKVEAEDQPFEPHNVWGAAWYRFKSKVGAKKEGVAQALRVAEARGNLPPSMERRTKPIEPLGAFDPEGNFKWDEKLKEKIESMTKKE